MRKLLQAYSLVEILVVMGIITALVMAAVAFFAPQSKKARDSKRKTDLYTIAKVLEEYEKDNDVYPAALTQCGITTSGSPLADYTTSIPCDPKTHANYTYEVGPNVTSRSWFRVYGQLENTGDGDIAQSGCTGGCGPGGSYNYYVASPNTPPVTTAGVLPTFFPTPTEGPGPVVNLLANPGFESGATNWTGVSGEASISTSVFHSGARSLRIVQPASGSKRVRQTISVVAGKNYSASGWIRTNNISSGNASIGIVWRNSSGVVISQGLIGNQAGTIDWKKSSSSQTAPSGAVTAYFQLSLSSGSAGTAWFDDLVFQ